MKKEENISMITESQLVELCNKGREEAYELMYRRYASKMFGVCLRYAKNKMEAEDVLQEGFIKVFQSLSSFRNEGSFEGWIRRIMVNTALNYYKHNLKYAETLDIDVYTDSPSISIDFYDKIEEKSLLKLIQSLPEGYRLVFNLFAIEGYSHKEIADMLGISESTSKTQLFRARKMLQEKLVKIQKSVYEKIA